MDILKDLTDAEVAVLARIPTPKPMAGVWVLTAPNGQTWTGDSPMKCVQEEIHSRVPPQVALARIRQSTWFPFPPGGDDAEGGGLTQCDMHEDESY
ncbi:MAG: hypothetical protein NDI59_02720 [Lysobacter sp.]|nr:hypothetical protein [Lysobacter sp.]